TRRLGQRLAVRIGAVEPAEISALAGSHARHEERHRSGRRLSQRGGGAEEPDGRETPQHDLLVLVHGYSPGRLYGRNARMRGRFGRAALSQAEIGTEGKA